MEKPTKEAVTEAFNDFLKKPEVTQLLNSIEVKEHGNIRPLFEISINHFGGVEFKIVARNNSCEGFTQYEKAYNKQ